MKRVAAYCRVSTDKDDQANSFESQQRYFREYIERHPDMELQEIYADEGISGTGTRKRKRFNAMIRAAKEGKIDLIVTKGVSRFARNTVDTLQYTRELKAIGIGVFFMNDGINTLEPDAELRLSIMASIAQEESRKTSSRVKWGQTRRMEQGVVFGGSLLGYDVVGGKMTVNSEGAAIVREIFRKYTDERKGAPTIAKELRDAGVLSSTGKCLWSAATVIKILKNEKYCGDLVQKKTYTPDFLTHSKKYNRGQEEKVVLRDHHEPIIDRDTFEWVQRELNRRHTEAQSSGHGNRYPLSGKIKCGCCGSSFQARKRHYKDKDGYWKVWRCGKATAEGKARVNANGEPVGCDVGRQLREDVAQDILKRSVQAVQLDADAITANLTRIVEDVLKSSQDDGSGEKRRIERELEAAKDKKMAAMDAFLERTISKEDFQFVNERCDREIAACQDRLAAIEQRQKLDTEGKTVKRDVRAAIRAIVNGEHADEAFYGRMLDHMTVHADGRVEVYLALLPTHWTYVLGGIADYEAKMQKIHATRSLDEQADTMGTDFFSHVSRLPQGGERNGDHSAFESEAFKMSHYGSSVPISVSSPFSSG